MSGDKLLSLSAQLQSGQPLSPADALSLVAEVRRLREALEEITRLGQGHLLSTAVDLARMALTRPAGSPPPACG